MRKPNVKNRIKYVLLFAFLIFSVTSVIGQIDTLQSVNTEEARSIEPDSTDANRADLMIKTTADGSDTYEGFVKFDISNVSAEYLVNASVVTYGGQHNPSGQSEIDPYWIDMYGCSTTDWPDPFTWNSTRSMDKSDLLASENIQGFAGGYTFGGDDVVAWIKAKKAEGATEVVFRYNAREELAWDIWLSGTWKGEELILEYDYTPAVIQSLNTQEARSIEPDSTDANRADLMIKTTADGSDTYEGFVKFDISKLVTDSLINAAVVTYAGQHNPSGQSEIDPYWIDMYGCNTTEWPDPFTWNSTRDMHKSDLLASENIQGFAGGYTFGGRAVADWIKAKKLEGATEVVFRFNAREELAWDIWLSGTWKGEELTFEYGVNPTPDTLQSIDTQEARSIEPDSTDANRADLMIKTTADNSDTYEGFVKFDISDVQIDSLIGAAVVTYAGQHNPSGQSEIDPYWIDMYGCNTTDWPEPFTWNSTRDMHKGDLLASENIQGFAGGYTFGGRAVAEWIKAKKLEGATEVAFRFNAREEQDWDIWLSGTWKGEELIFEYGVVPSPDTLQSIDTQEARSIEPDSTDANRADLMIKTTADDSDTYEGFVKFDISDVQIDSLIGAAVVTYAGQHNPSGQSEIDPYWIDMYGCNTTDWPEPFTWNSTRDMHKGDLLASENIQGFAGGYTFGGRAVAEWIKAKKLEGATEVAFRFNAREELAWDIWLSGTWKGEELIFEYGVPETPDTLQSIDTQEARSIEPDSTDANRADLMIKTTSDGSDTYEGFVKFDIRFVQIDSLIGAAVVTYGGQHNPSGQSEIDPYWIDMYACNTTDWPEPFTWNSTRSMHKGDLLASENIQGFAGGYTFGGKAVVEWIKAKKKEGATEVAFRFEARDQHPWDIWLSGTWKGEELVLKYGIPETPDQLLSIDTQEAGSLNPDGEDVNRADIMVHKTDGDADSYEAFVKFDIRFLKTDSLVGASLVTWGGQHNPSGQARIAQYWVDMYGCTNTDWPDPFTWNSTRSFDKGAEVLGSANIQEQAGGYTFTSDALLDWIKERKAEGATEVVFRYEARIIQPWDIWLSGTWKGQDLVFEYGEPVSVSQLKESTVNFYPNPVRDQLNLSNLSSGSIVSVFNISGSKVLEARNGNMSKLNIGMGEFRPGVYLVRITSNSNHIQSIKVIKK